jgi:organic radical activating enzyme
MNHDTIIELLLTNNCNRDCAYCVGKSKDETTAIHAKAINDCGDYKMGAGVLNLRQVKRWLLHNDLNNSENAQLVISGGEPTLVRELPGFIDWLSDKGFKPPILYTNGRNIEDLAHMKNNKSVKVILTKHLETEFRRHGNSLFKDKIKFLEDTQIPFLLKVLTDGREVEVDKVRNSVVEGIRKNYSDDVKECVAQVAGYENLLDGSSPYRWRWNGYGDKIDRTRTKMKLTKIYTVTPPGEIFNCHLFNEGSIGSIYDAELLKDKPSQLGLCFYADDPIDLSIFPELNCDTRCEIQHYANLMEGVK